MQKKCKGAITGVNECAGVDLAYIYNNSTISDFRVSTLFATFASKSRNFLSKIPVVGINLGIVRVKMHGRAKKVVFCDFGDPKNEILIGTYFSSERSWCLLR